MCSVSGTHLVLDPVHMPFQQRDCVSILKDPCKSGLAMLQRTGRT